MDESSSNSSPSFLGLFPRRGRDTDQCLPCDFTGDAKDFGVSLEVSFIERKKNEESLTKAEPRFNSSGFFTDLLLRANRRYQSTIPRDRSQSPETSQRCGNWPGPKGLGKSRCQSIASDE